MSQKDHPQIYLVTPAQFSLSEFPVQLSGLLDAVEVACLRLSLGSTDEDAIMRAADAVRSVAHDHDVPIVIDNHTALAERLGLDGVHLTDGAKNVRAARKLLGADAIVGAFCGTFRHDGMIAGESGADYVAFGPVGETSLGSGEQAPSDLFQWWSDMIELPIVAEGALDQATVAMLAPATDFFSLRDEVWNSENPIETLRGFDRLMTE